MIAELDNDIIGAAILRDWIGGGGEPVSKELADKRAHQCLQCPMHRPAKFWEVAFKDPIARAIRRQLEMKRKMDLRLSCEEQIAMCATCGCCMRLKCWTPIKHIAEHTTDDKLSEYPKTGCWIRSEIESLKKESHV